MRRAFVMAVWATCASWTLVVRAEIVRLDELETKALENRPALLREGARTRVAEAEARKAASAYYPHFAIRGDSSIGPGRQLLRVGSENEKGGYLVAGAAPLTDNNNNTREAFRFFPRTALELTASANLYDFGRTQAATAAGREGHAAALASRSLTEAEIRGAVRESYLAWLLTSELVRLSAAALQEAGARRERVAALVKEGVRPKGELTPARADELLAQLELERAQRDLGSARLTLEYTVGTALSGSAEPDTELLEAESRLPDRSEQDARSRRALLQRYKAAKSQAAAQATLNRPQLGIGLTAGLRISTQSIFNVDKERLDSNERGAPESNGKNSTQIFPLYTAGLTLNVPLWDGGFTRAGIDAARAHADEAKADLAEFENERAFTQSQAELDASSALGRLRTAEELVSVCAARLKDAEDGYDLGASSIELIGQARSLLRRAQTEALLARADHAAARLRMVQRDGSGPQR